MKKHSLNNILGALIIFSMLNLFSCTKDQDGFNENAAIEASQFPQLSEATPEIANDITLQNGLLKFTSSESFRNTLLGLNRMTPQDQLQWENDMNFVSMQQIFNAIISAEYETVGSHSTIYETNLEVGLISKNEATGLYDLSLFNPAYAPVLNKNGMVMVAGTIYQFAKSSLKIWKNGDPNRLEALINTSTSTDEIEVVDKRFDGAVSRNVTTWTEECESGDNDGMLRLSTFYNSDYVEQGNLDVVFIDYNLNITSLIMTSGNEWEIDPNASVKLKGKSHIQFTVSDGTNERTRLMRKEYHDISGSGGNFNFIPAEATNYNFGAPWHFVNPATLMQAKWIASNRLGDGSIFSCEITF